MIESDKKITNGKFGINRLHVGCFIAGWLNLKTMRVYGACVISVQLGSVQTGQLEI